MGDYTKDDLANLQASIAKGVSEAQVGQERLKFRSLNEMLRLEKKIKSDLGLSPPRRRMHYPNTSGGFR